MSVYKLNKNKTNTVLAQKALLNNNSKPDETKKREEYVAGL
jgi:hypothetical protein